MKKVLLVALLALVMSANVMAWDGLADVDVTLDATFVSKYIWRGYDLYNDKGAFQPSINIDFNNGWSANVWYSVAGASGAVDGEELDYAIAYTNTAWAAEKHQVDYTFNWIYYDYPDAPSIKDNVGLDAQELNVDLVMPNLCDSGIVPHYEFAYLWSSRGGTMGTGADGHGFLHTVGVAYDYAMCGFLPNNPDQVLTFTADAVYNDGVFNADHDWSHVLFGVSTPIVWGPGVFTPAVYFQKSMDDSVNVNDEFFSGFSYTLNF